MVSTRKKAYKSPPHLTGSPPRSAKKAAPVKKLFSHLTKVQESPSESSSDCHTENHEFKLNSPTNKEQKTNISENDYGGQLSLVIDKLPSQSVIHSESIPVLSDLEKDTSSQSQSTQLEGNVDTDTDTNSLDIRSIDSSCEPEQEEVYEIDMTNVTTAADDSIQLRLEGEDSDSDSYSNSETEDNNQMLDICEENSDDVLNESTTSMNKSITSNDKSLLNIDKEDIGKGMDQSEQQLFVIDKGPNCDEPEDIASSQLFIIDKDTSDRNEVLPSDESSSSSEESDDDSSQPAPTGYNLASRIHCPLNLRNVSYINFHPLSKKPVPNTTIKSMKDKQVEELMKKSVLKPGFEKKQFVEPQVGKRKLKRERRAERSKTKGSKWYDMAAPEMTSALKNDLSVLQMRRALDPKRFYKNNDMPGLPKYFQMGRVVESSADFYHARVPKRQRKANIVEELLADAEFKKYNKKKYVEIQEKKIQRSRGAYKHMKRLKRKK